jgi:hypothetical protein
MLNILNDVFATKTWIPAWLVDEIGAAHANRRLTNNLLPRFSMKEFPYLIHLLGEVQREYLANGALVTLSYDTCQRQNQGASEKVVQDIAKVFSALHSLVRLDEGTCNPFFTLKEFSDDGDLILELTATAPLFIFGIHDAYGFPQIPLRRDSSPSLLQKSLWFDLPVELLPLWLTIERASTATANPMQMEGVFGIDFERLDKTVELPKASQDPQESLVQGQSPAGERQRLLKSLLELGQYLIDHGSLTPFKEHLFLALGAENPSAGTLLWQVKDEALRQESRNWIQGQVGQRYSQIHVEQYQKYLWQMSKYYQTHFHYQAFESHGDPRRWLCKVFNELTADCGPIEAKGIPSHGSWLVEEGVYLDPRCVFLDLLLTPRPLSGKAVAKDNGLARLDEFLRAHDIVSQNAANALDLSLSALRQAFQGFKDFMKRSPGLLSTLWSGKLGLSGSPHHEMKQQISSHEFSLDHQHIGKIPEIFASNACKVSSHNLKTSPSEPQKPTLSDLEIIPAKAQLPEISRSSEPNNIRKVSEKLAGKGDWDEENLEHAASALQSPDSKSIKSPEPQPKAPHGDNGRAQRRLIASQEFAKIQENEQKYAQLRRDYLESLPRDELDLVLDVQRRMQPTHFKNHLRHRLIRFMAENPNSWTSSPPRRAESS